MPSCLDLSFGRWSNWIAGAGGHEVMLAAAGRPGQVWCWAAHQAGSPAWIPSGCAAPVPLPAVRAGHASNFGNIRLTSEDLGALRARALQEGIPYQTLISSVLHKYVCGRLLDRP